MKSVLDDIFSRTLSSLSKREHSSLQLEHLTSIEDSQSLKVQIGTALIIGADGQKKEPLALIAITTPKLAADDQALLAFVVRRAQANKAPYFLTWTLRDAVLWRTPKPGTPAERSHIEKIRDYEANYEIAQDAADQIFDEPLRLRAIACGHKLLFDLERLFKDQALELVRIEATYFVQRLIDSVHELLPMVTDSLHTRFSMDMDVRARFSQWATEQSIVGSPNDREFAQSIARHLIYRLLGKILFYQSLRRVARHLPALDLTGANPSQILPALRSCFAEALKVDYHAVFSEELPDTVSWPSNAAKHLAGLIHDFNTRDFSSLPQDVIGAVFERLIPPEDRHLLGQYFTSESLCDLGIAFCVRSPNALVADVTCGTGTFLIRAYDRKRWLGNHDHAALLSQLWGIEVAPFPAELAVINLFRQSLTATGNFPRITCRDFFTIKPGDTLPFPPLKMDFSNPLQIQEQVPLFDAIVGNFPYKSADQIEQKDTHYLEFLRLTLIQDWFENYPRLFCYPSKQEQAEFERAIAGGKHKSCNPDRAQLYISAFADIYVYLFFHAARFLKPGGRMGIITSNAWLDVSYGFELQRFFCDQFKIVAILESRCEPWFTEASVNTVFTILERCEEPKDRDNHLVKFVKVKKQLADLIPGDPQVQAVERWQRLCRLTDRIEVAGHKDARTVPLGVVSEEDENFRVRLCRQGELREELDAAKKTVKWGKLLRAPEVVLEIMKQSRLVPLSSCATVEFGGKSGVNEFFYLDAEAVKTHGIEKEFLRPLLKSPTGVNRIAIDIDELDTQVFVCRLTKQELKNRGGHGALAYIEWGETQIFRTGRLQGLTWPNGIEVRNRKPGWYALPEYRSKPAHVFLSKAFHDRHMQRFSPEPLIADQRLYFLSPSANLTEKLLGALLNSFVTALMVETFGRLMLGDGVLELAVEDAKEYLMVPDLRNLTAVHKKHITSAFDVLCKRKIGTVFEEVKEKDRQALDSAILAALGLDSKSYLKPIYQGLCELVQERIGLGQQRGKMRKTKTRKAKAEKESYQETLDEVLPDGPKRFPDDFLSVNAAKGERFEVPLPEAKLRLDITPIFVTLHADKKLFREVKNPPEGKFILYCQHAGQKVARLPAKPVEVSRSVANYEAYLRDLRRNLYESFYRRTLDVAVAQRLTQAVFERFKLPTVDSQ